MDLYHTDFEYLCRICAANTKGKYSVPECVYIFKTIGLKQKIEKYLYLGISETDALPKVLCKTCFRQVEATASLSKIAKHTQKVFRDFLLSAGKQLLSINIDEHQDNIQAVYDGYTNQVTTQKSTPSATEGRLQQPPALIPLPMPPPPPPAPEQHREEVVLNVSVNDPLTRETQQKMISASQRQRSLPAFPTNTDNRFTPRSIAQRAFTSSAKDIDMVSSINTPPAIQTQNNNNPSTSKKYSPPGVINFFHTRTTASAEAVDKAILVPKPFMEEMIPAVSIKKTETAPGTIQKRKQIKITNTMMPRPLPALKTTTGQVSLLKASQPKHSPVATTKISPLMQQPVHTIQAKNIKDLQNPAMKLANFVDEVDEQLPPRMIIAAPKTNKNKSPHDQQSVATKVEAKAVSTVIVPSKDIKKDTIAHQKQTQKQTTSQKQQQQQSQPTAVAGTSVSSAFANNFDNNTLLGKVIRDLDLLKLIMKALKWPVNEKTLELQIMRLRNSKFMDIMSDRNLLQDTDLTQILGPIIYAAQTLQQQQQQQQQQQAEVQQRKSVVAGADLAAEKQHNLTNALKQVPKNTAQAMELASALTYKLPAETSVQLVPASPESEEPQSSGSSSVSLLEYKRIMPLKKQKRKLCGEQTKLEVQLDASDEDLLGTQKIKIKSSTNLFEQRKTQSAEKPDVELLKLDETNKQLNISDESLFDTDDIILMEQQPALEAYNSNNNKQNFATGSTDKQMPTTVIARPNIKRRKTVIQTTTKAEKLAKRMASVSETQETSTTTEKTQQQQQQEAAIETKKDTEKPIEKSTLELDDKMKTEAMQPVAQVEETAYANDTLSENSLKVSSSNSTTTLTLTPDTNTTITTAASAKGKSTTSINANPANGNSSKITGKRAQLGQKLLQAIGCMGENEPKRHSVAQIRSALQRSLKEAQEQRLRKQEADSTTSKVVKNETELYAKEHKQVKSKEHENITNIKRKLSAEDDDMSYKKIELNASVSEENISIPDDVSSTAENLGGRKRGRKSKIDRDSKLSKTDQSEDEEVRSDITNESTSTNRPTRMSKTLSKYYKGPEQNAPNRRALPSRAARSRN